MSFCIAAQALRGRMRRRFVIGSNVLRPSVGVALTTYIIVSSLTRVSSRTATTGVRGATRRRLPADQARRRILEAAERRLAAVGPEGLRLTELAAELGISHPAILHHFGSREGLVAEVVRQAFTRLNDELMAAVAKGGGKGGQALLDRVAEFYATSGHARAIAWLLLSGRRPRQGTPQKDPPHFRRLIELIHAQRLERDPTADLGDTAFRAELTALALLGAAVFGDLILGEAGTKPGTESAREFRRRLGELVWPARR
jgi:AcrR family transcriptional regulator